MNTRIIITTLLLIANGVLSQNFFPILGGQRVGTSGFTFLKIGVSARAVGMGEAVVAVDQDAGSLYYNPAIIAQLPKTAVSASHISWPADISYDFFSGTMKISGRHHMGLMAGILHMAPMEETTEYRPHGTGNYFVFQDRFIGLSYGVAMTDRFSFGITTKYVVEELAGSMMENVLLDMGTFYWTGYKSLRFSAALSHFGNQSAPSGTFSKRVLDKDTGEERYINSEYTRFSPPTMFQVGAAMNIIDMSQHTLLASLQLNHPVDNTEHIVYGFEYTFMNAFFLRGGYKSNKEEEDLSLGMGVNVMLGGYEFRVDYAYTNLVHLSDPTRLSLGVSF